MLNVRTSPTAVEAEIAGPVREAHADDRDGRVVVVTTTSEFVHLTPDVVRAIVQADDRRRARLRRAR